MKTAMVRFHYKHGLNLISWARNGIDWQNRLCVYACSRALSALKEGKILNGEDSYLAAA